MRGLQATFKDAASFNQPLNSWVTGKITTMQVRRGPNERPGVGQEGRVDLSRSLSIPASARASSRARTSTTRWANHAIAPPPLLLLHLSQRHLHVCGAGQDGLVARPRRVQVLALHRVRRRRGVSVRGLLETIMREEEKMIVRAVDIACLISCERVNVVARTETVKCRWSSGVAYYYLLTYYSSV